MKVIYSFDGKLERRNLEIKHIALELMKLNASNANPFLAIYWLNQATALYDTKIKPAPEGQS